MITWECLSCQGKSHYNRDRGVTIHGTEGTVLLDRGGYEIYDLKDKMLEERKASRASTTQDVRSIDNMTTNHFGNLMNGIRGGEKLRSPIAEVNPSVAVLQLSNIAWKVKRTLHLDKQNGHILDDPKAMGLWSREYEKGWELKV